MKWLWFRGAWHRLRGFAGLVFNVARETISGYRALDCNSRAAAISYYALLSFMPFMILTLSIMGFVLAAMGAHGDSKREFLNALLGPAHHIAPFLRTELLDELVAIVEVRTVSGIVSFVAVLFSASLVFGALESSLDTIFLVQKRRHFVVSKLLFIGFMVALVFLILAGHYLMVLVNGWLTAVEQPTLEDVVNSTHAGGMVISMVGTMVAFVALVRYFCRMSVPFKALLLGALLFFFLFEVSKQLFMLFLEYVAQFNVVYGSLSTLMIVIVWVYYISSVFLLSALAVRVVLDGGHLGDHIRTLSHYYAVDLNDLVDGPSAPAGGPSVAGEPTVVERNGCSSEENP